MKRLPLVADFILFITLCASLAYWGMQFFKPQSRPVGPPPQMAAPSGPRIEAAAGLFGGRPAGNVVASNFALKGVIAAGPNGVAILAADGKPAQAIGVGMEAEPGVTLKEVHATYVLLNEGGVIKRVDLPENAKPGLDVGGPPPVAAAAPAAPPMPAPTMEVNNGQMPSQQPPGRRPSGIGPAAFGAVPTQAPNPAPPSGPQPVNPNEAPTPNPMPGGGHPGLQQ
jgi:general secretion pathway protein C